MDVLEKIRKQLDKNGFDKVELYYTFGRDELSKRYERTSHSQCDRVGQEILSTGFPVLPTTAGPGPMHTVFDALEVPMVAFGLGNANSRDHGGMKMCESPIITPILELVGEELD